MMLHRMFQKADMQHRKKAVLVTSPFPAILYTIDSLDVESVT